MNSTSAFRISAVFGFLGVTLGALGAHGAVATIIQKNHTVDDWKTATLYHLVHAVVMLFLATRRPFPVLSWSLFAAGVTLFSGSLYLFAVSGPRWLVFITPVGGLCFLAGWLVLAVRPCVSAPS